MKNGISKGRQSIGFTEAPFILSAGTIVGQKESQGPIGKLFDEKGRDKNNLFGKATWEEAEGEMQKRACIRAIKKAGLSQDKIRFLFGGDLLRQGTATSLGIESLKIPLFGLFGACSTSGEAIALGAMSVAAGYADYVLAVTSSHFGSAEKEFRFPLGYASQRPLSAQWTVTGSGAFIIGNIKSKVRVSGVTVGKIVDFGLKDSQNMGGCMAPAACDTILTHIKDFGYGIDEYDQIVTGDLGYIGSSILLDLLKKNGVDIEGKHMDCGMKIFDQKTQDTHAGGSGCGCAAVTLGAFVLPKIIKGEWKKILFVPTGALMSTVSFNEGESIPGIAHGIIIEHAG